MATPFRLPSKAAAVWFHVGSTSAFKDITDSGQQTLAACDDEGHGPPCKVFSISAPDAAQPNEMSEIEDLEDAPLGGALADQVLVFRFQGKFHAIDNVSQCPLVLYTGCTDR